MEITSSQTPTLTPPVSAAATSAQTNAVLSSDFETFLRMLTAQARFQDPLEPIDSSEYAAQLAQFSMVEQQVLSNDLLTALTSQIGSNNMSQMAHWVGMDARTTAATYYDGSPITITPNPAATSDTVNLVVYDALGVEVQRLTLPIAANPVEWAGVTTDGTPFPNGFYNFKIESRMNGEPILIDSVETYSRITEARMEGNDIVLILEDGTTVVSSEVTGLRAP